MRRRDVTALLLSLAGAAACPDWVQAAPTGRFGPAQPFSWPALIARARRLSRQPYLRGAVSKLAVHDFDTHVRLAYGKAEALAGDVRLFPTQNNISPLAVGINVVAGGMARPVIDTLGLFADGQRADAAGFRVVDPDGRADWLAFLGASYFRTCGTQGQYGLSARGVAVNTGLPGPEEFPIFTDFWIERKSDSRFIVYALLDSPSLSGVFAIDSQHGHDGIVQEVRTSLFLRRDVARLGIAPQTSMFLFDRALIGTGPERRQAIHDSEGLAIRSGTGERIWRPLRQPRAATIHAFRADHPRGFGLMQRDRIAGHYHFDGSYYEKRPSLWVEPKGDWGTGAVMLYEMTSISENVDNIGAFWVSDAPALAGQRRDLGYRLTWTSSDPSADSNARCTDMVVPTAADFKAGILKYRIDFTGPALMGLDHTSGMEAVTNLPAQAILSQDVSSVTGMPATWRVRLQIRAGSLTQSDIRLYLRRHGGAVSETVIMDVAR
jgi:glucans biosynthesis protein